MAEKKIYYKSILSNRFAYIPFWKNREDLKDYFLFNNNKNSYTFVNKDNNFYALDRIVNLSKLDKFLYYGGDILSIIFIAIIAILSFSTKYFLSDILLYFIIITAISYIFMFKFKKVKLANIIAFFGVLSLGFLMILKGNFVNLYYNFIFLCCLYMIFSINVPTLISKIFYTKDKDGKKIMFFKFKDNLKGFLLTLYSQDKLSEEEVELLEKSQLAKKKKEQELKNKKTKEINEDDDDE